MKILLIATEYPPRGSGIAQVIFNLQKQLTNKGHEVHIRSPSGEEAERIQKIGGLGILAFWRVVKKEINDGVWKHMDLVWCHNPLFDTPVIPEKLLCTVHTTYTGRWVQMPAVLMPWESAYYLWMNYQEKRCFKAMSNLKFTTTNESTITELKNLGISDVLLIPNGIDSEAFVPQEKEVASYCSVTRFVHWKQVDKTVEKFNNYPIGDFKLRIIGDGPLFKSVQKKVRNENIELLGKLEPSKTKLIMAQSMFFVSNSLYEGMPIALLEALSCGCIPLISDIPGHRELVEPIKNMTDPQQIHDYIKTNYDWAVIIDKYLEAIQHESN